MYIPKSLYEALPYFYIGCSIAIFILADSPVIYLSTALLYAAGSLIWVTRSAYRRNNSKHQIENRRGRFRFPELVYEYLPFIYLAIGIVAVVQIPGLYGAIPGGILCLAGVLVWLIRAIYRTHSSPMAGA